MPCRWPLSSTNCSGGKVGLIDMTSVPALMMLGGAILGWARTTPGARANTEAATPALSKPRRRNVVESMDDLFMSVPRRRSPHRMQFCRRIAGLARADSGDAAPALD